MNVVCRFCKTPLSLAEDSQEARVAGTDPLRQMQRHINDCGAGLKLGFNISILATALAFRPVSESDDPLYRSRLIMILDWLLAGGIEDNQFVPHAANVKPSEGSANAGGKE